MENFQRNFSTGEVEVQGSVIYHKTEYKERRNHYAFYSVNHKVQGFDTDRESFIGLYNDFSSPECVVKGISKKQYCPRMEPHRQPSYRHHTRAGRKQGFHLHPRICGERAG